VQGEGTGGRKWKGGDVRREGKKRKKGGERMLPQCEMLLTYSPVACFPVLVTFNIKRTVF